MAHGVMERAICMELCTQKHLHNWSTAQCHMDHAIMVTHASCNMHESNEAMHDGISLRR
jgi:hypothetical protein